MTAKRIAAGSIHGRFQPFHNGHLEYLTAALDQCDYIYIGITQFRRRSLIQVKPVAALHRAQPQSNPLSYFERLVMIQSLLRSLGIGPERYCVTPFPIEEPSELNDFLPTHITVFTTTYDEWNERKIAVLEEHGYPVVNLWSRSEKVVAGQRIRELLRDDDDGWRALVPNAVADFLEELGIGERLRALALPEG